MVTHLERVSAVLPIKVEPQRAASASRAAGRPDDDLLAVQPANVETARVVFKRTQDKSAAMGRKRMHIPATSRDQKGCLAADTGWWVDTRGNGFVGSD